MGRDKIFKEGRIQVGVYLTSEEFDALENIRWRERKSKAEVGREAVVEYIKAHGEGNNAFKLDQFQDPNFRAVPTIHADREKWISHYKDSNREDRVKLNIKINDLQKVFKMIEVNENRK